MDVHNHHEFRINIEIGGEGVRQKTWVNFAGCCWGAAPFFQVSQSHTWAHACAPVFIDAYIYKRELLKAMQDYFHQPTEDKTHEVMTVIMTTWLRCVIRTSCCSWQTYVICSRTTIAMTRSTQVATAACILSLLLSFAADDDDGIALYDVCCNL